MKKLHKKIYILKRSGVLLIAAIMILSVVSITANTDEDDNIDLVDHNILLAKYNIDHVSNENHINTNAGEKNNDYSRSGIACLVEVNNSDAAGLTDLAVNVTEWAAAGYLTYDLVVEVNNGDSWVATWCNTTIINAIFWEHPAGGHLPPNPAVFDEYGLLKYDSFWTCPKEFPNPVVAQGATMFAPGSPIVVTGTQREAEWFTFGPPIVDGDNYTIARFTFLGTETITLTAEGDVYFANSGSTPWPFYLTVTINGELNNPPYEPSDPDPEDGETNVGIDADLSWTGGDPDPGDIVTYDVYFGTTSPPPQVATGQSGTTYDPGTMNYNTQYFWQIVAWDNHGEHADGPEWSFTTEEEPIPEPDLDCEGTLSWTEVEPGATVTGSFTVENIGDAGSELDWEIDDYPEWGTWTFTPESGEDLTPEDGPVTVSVSVVAPDEEEQTFTGEVKIINSEDSGDYCTIDASLATPRSHSLPLFFERLFERFPNAFPILRYLFGL